MTESPEPADRRRKLLKFAISVAAAALLLFLLIRAADWGEVWKTLRQLSAGTWCAVLAVHGTIYALRTMRFAALIPDRRVPFPQLWSIQAANQLAAQLLPLRTGEVTYPIYLRGAGVPLEVGVAGLVVSRALDLLAVLTITVFSAIWIGTPIEKLTLAAGIPLVLGIALFAAALLAVATGGAPFIRFLAAMGGRFGVSLRILGRVEQVARGFETVGRYRALAEAFTLTLLIWIGVDVFYWLLMTDLGFAHLGPVDVAFGASAAIMTNLLPVNTFAGLGTQEAGWTWGFHLLELKYDAALASGLAVHAVQLVNVGILGVVAQLRLSPAPRAEADRAQRWIAARRERLGALLDSIDAETARLRPAPGRWSVAETVAHLARVEKTLASKLRAVLDRPGDVPAGRRVRIPLFVVAWRPFFARFRAPEVARPAEGVSLAEAREELARARPDFDACVAEGSDGELRGKRLGHHLLGALDVIEWVWFVGYHEERHRKQILETLRSLRRTPARG